MTARTARRIIGGVLGLTVLAATLARVVGATPRAAEPPADLRRVVPVPVTVLPADGVTFEVTAGTGIYAGGGADTVANLLAELLRAPTGYPLPVAAMPADPPSGGISLSLSGADPSVGPQGYQLDVTADAVVIRAQQPAGLSAGVQTLRQLLPPAARSATRQDGPWPVPGGRIIDHPRFGYRGAMLDVVRHFRPVADVYRYIDELALVKINYLHLHLSDDQGWRIHINSRPRLTEIGGRTQVGGGPGGFYTQAQYRDIVAYAARRSVTVVPEIDMPGHTGAALSSYPELNCDGIAPAPYTGTEVGFSSLCVEKEATFAFVEDVVREVAALTPGPYLHIGGDEANSTAPPDYVTFMQRAQDIVAANGKASIAWHQAAQATTRQSTLLQYWNTKRANAEVAHQVSLGRGVIMSPANKAYLDMKYHPGTPIGLSWAGTIEVRDAYEWDPAVFLKGVGESAVRGVEAPLWTETVVTRADMEYLALPRLAALAEVAWSPQDRREWTDFRSRLAALGRHWTVAAVQFHRSAQVPWDTGR